LSRRLCAFSCAASAKTLKEFVAINQAFFENTVRKVRRLMLHHIQTSDKFEQFIKTVLLVLKNSQYLNEFAVVPGVTVSPIIFDTADQLKDALNLSKDKADFAL
jgi:hypothetical protein